jgi:hypothetical protein
MYYRDFEKIQRMEKMLEKLAYLSVVFDFLVAVATFFVLRGVQSYSYLLTISSYLLTIEVVIAGILFVSLIALKHYRKLINTVALASFRSKYVPISGVNGVPLLKKFFKVILAVFVSKQ